MYPLNMTLPGEVVAFAVANDVAEHRSLSAAGYQPALDEEGAEPTVESLRAELDAKGIAYDNRWGIAKLKAALQ